MLRHRKLALAAALLTGLTAAQGVAGQADDVAKLFGRFTRVGPASGAIAGTGLGLYLCREAARLHGGEVTVESTPGKGSVFTAEIPLSNR